MTPTRFYMTGLLVCLGAAPGRLGGVLEEKGTARPLAPRGLPPDPDFYQMYGNDVLDMSHIRERGCLSLKRYSVACVCGHVSRPPPKTRNAKERRIVCLDSTMRESERAFRTGTEKT